MRKIEIRSIEDISSIAPKNMPRIDLFKKESSSFLCVMRNETNDWLEYTDAAKRMINKHYMSGFQLPGVSIIQDTICSAMASTLTRGDTSYTRDVAAMAHPSGQKIYKVNSLGTFPQGSLDIPGRMNGLTGWSLDRDLIAGSLASFTHNFVAFMMAFFERAKLPLLNSAILPNLVLPETKEPKQFVLPLSVEYNLLPTPAMFTNIKVSAPVESEMKVIQWNANKQDLAETEVIPLEVGTQYITLFTQLNPFENAGILNIEPINAPGGLVIESINTIPPTF